MKNLGLTTLPLGMPSVSTFVSDRISLTLILKDLGLRKFCMKLNILFLTPASFVSIRMSRLHVESYVFFTSKKMLASAFPTVDSETKKIWIVVRLALASHCSVDSVTFWSKKSNSLTLTILSITLHRTLVRANERCFEGFVGYFPGVEIGSIVDSNHFSGKYHCCHILLCRIRREFYPSGGRRLKIGS